MIKRLYVTVAVGNVADAVVLSFVPLAAAAAGMSPRTIGLFTAGALLAWLLSPGVGVWLDTIGPLRGLRLSVWARACLLGGAGGYLFIAGEAVAPAALLLVLAVGTGFTDMVSDLSTQTAVGQLVDPSKSTTAYGRIVAIQAVSAGVLAPPMAGVMVSRPPGIGLLVLALVAVTLLLIPIRMGKGSVTQNDPGLGAASGDGFFRNAAQGFVVVLHDSWLRRSAVTVGVLNVGSAVAGTTFVVYLVQDRNVAPAQLGLMLGIAGIGVPLGGVMASRVTSRLGFRWSVQLGLVGLLTSMGAPLLSYDLWVLGGILLVSGLCSPLMGVSMISHRQQAVEPAFAGRVNGIFQLAGIGLAPVGALTGGYVVELFGAYPVFLGVVGLCLAVALVCRPWRRSDLD